MSLGTEVGLGPGDIVLDGNPAPPQRGTAPAMSVVANRSGWIKMPLGTEVGLDPGHIVLDGQPKGPEQSPPLFVPCRFWPNGRPSQLLLSICYGRHALQMRTLYFQLWFLFSFFSA